MGATSISISQSNSRRPPSPLPRRRRMSSPSSLRFLLLLLLFLLCFRSSSGLHSKHPLHAAVDRVNELGPFVGLVMAYPTETEALQSSGAFVATSTPLDLYGRRFHIGRIRDVDVIYVMSGQRRLNAGITVQILLDVFNVWGIVHYGIAGSANNSLSFGDVSIPESVAFTGSWTWTVELQRCINETFCLPKAPEVVSGLKASTADVFVDNAAYRKFLFQEFGVSTVDEESSAVVMTAMSPGVPVIVFRGVSDLAGGENSWSSSMILSDLAAVNAVKVAVEFIGAIGSQ